MLGWRKKGATSGFGLKVMLGRSTFPQVTVHCRYLVEIDQRYPRTTLLGTVVAQDKYITYPVHDFLFGFHTHYPFI